MHVIVYGKSNKRIPSVDPHAPHILHVESPGVFELGSRSTLALRLLLHDLAGPA